MRKQLLAVAVLATTLVAAAAGPNPIITLAGATAAAKLTAQQQAALAPRVEALNTALTKVVTAQASVANGTAEQRAQVHASLRGIHEECMKLHHEIMQQLEPEQRAAYMEYVHQQLKAAGLDPAQFHHSHGGPGLIPHGVH